MDQQTLLIFLGLVFGAAFLLAQFVFVPAFGTGQRERRRLRARLGTLEKDSTADGVVSLLRQKYLRNLSPLEKALESLPGMDALESFIERSGQEFPAYRLVLLSLALGTAGGLGTWWFTRSPWIAGMVGVLFAVLPVFKLRRDGMNRFDRFEEQLPEALDMMTRALRSGHPLSETLHVVATEMDAPISREFSLTFDEINFGMDLRRALRNLVGRMPSLSLMAVVTTILVQRETGGNLAETLENISGVIRGRFRFHRRVRTITAEGRMSAWILALLPFALFAVISVVNPDYVAPLLHDPVGEKVVVIALAMQVVGNIWIRKLLKLDI